MTSLKIYIDEAMLEARKEALEAQAEARYYRKMHLNNLIRRAEYSGREMEVYMVTSPIPPVLASQQENTSTVQTVTRRRFSKEIAEELLAEKGDFAYFYALEKLGDYQSEELKMLWRDVLTWLDELKGEEK